MSGLEATSRAPADACNFVGGKAVRGSGSDNCRLYSPYTGEPAGEAYVLDSAQIQKAVSVAAEAQSHWGALTFKERSHVLWKWHGVLQQRRTEVARCVSHESGKLLSEALAEVDKGIEVLEFALGVQNFLPTQSVEVSRGVWCQSFIEPIGVGMGITPFNFPFMVPMWMIPLALVMGNSFVLKPSPLAARTPWHLAQSLADAGLPDGVFGVVHGGAGVVQALAQHAQVGAVAFVGSTDVARRVYALATGHSKRALALGGAKNPIILMPDAAPDAAEQIVASFTGCAGQRCMAASVLLAVGDDAEAMVEQVVQKARNLKLGQDMGAMVSLEAKKRAQKNIALALQEGAQCRLSARECCQGHLKPEWAKGYWLGPTVLDYVKPGSVALGREFFAPVLSVVRCSTLDEALDVVGALPYGNAVSVFTQSGAVARRVAQRARAGMVGVNIGVPVPREPFGFGGYGESKFGAGDITGADGVRFWSRQKKLTSKWSTSGGAANWMS